MHIRSTFGYLAQITLAGLAQLAAQPIERTVTFTNTPSAQQAAEITTVIRAVSDTNPVSNSGGLMLRGEAEQIALAEWLMAALDRSPAGPAPQAATLANGEFHLSASLPGGDNVVRVAYLPWASPQDLAEVSTIVRSIGDFRPVFTVSVMKAVAMRGTAEQIAMADWLMSQLAPYGVRAPEFQLSGPGDRIVRVMNGDFMKTPQQLAEASFMLRGIADIRRVFTYNRGHITVLRGTAEQMVLAEWLYQQLATRPKERAVPYPAGVMAERLTLFFPTVSDAAALTTAAMDVRTGVEESRVFTYGPSSALAVRGTAAQLATADRILKDRGY